MRKHKRFWVIGVYGLFLIFSVPWYWPDTDTRQLAGLPLWVLCVLFVGFCASVFTAWNLLYASEPEQSDDDSKQ